MQHYQNILVPVDFSSASCYALKNADDLSKMIKARLTVLHVVDYIPPNYVASTIPAKYASGELLVERARQQVDELITDMGLKNCDIVIKPGKAKNIIIHEVAEKNIDLIIMGAHDESMSGFSLGSIANRIIHSASCDVMLVRNDPN